MTISVVVRTRDDEPFLRDTLESVRRETAAAWLLVMANNSENRPLSSDCLSLVDQVVSIPDGQYRPGEVLNRAMELTPGEVVVFLNADCVPRKQGWLEALVEPLLTGKVGATFGCQVPRANCYPPLARDTLETFGDGSLQGRWRQCFSMAISAVRRDVWQALPFDAGLRYSEDIAWSAALVAAGFRIEYRAAAVVEHSHNYSLRQFYQRQKGEGEAEASIFAWTRWRSSWIRYTLLPLLRQIWRDTAYCLARRHYPWLVGSLVYRLVGALGRRRGFLQGRRP
jgi:rhamnosyltransferase